MSTWSVETLNEVVDRELNALPQDMRVRFVRISQLIHEFGPFSSWHATHQKFEQQVLGNSSQRS